MKFDVIVGNPPYNRSLDYEFIKLAYRLTDRYISFIHPARWKSAINNELALYVQKIMLDDKHLKEIHLFESWHANMTEVWKGVQAGSINYWLVDKQNEYEYIDTYIDMSSKNKDDQPLYERRKGRGTAFPYFCMNPIVLSIIEKVVSNDKFKSIHYRFLSTGKEEVHISNTLYRAYREDEKTGDSKPRDFDVKDIDNINNYLSTPFWRAITRQFMSGFHSCSIEFFNYMPDFDFSNDRITEEYIENYFELDNIQKDYLKKFSATITDSP